MRLPLLAVVSALPFLLAGCSGSSDDDDGGEHGHAEVAIEGSAFNPRTTTIRVGDGVVWANHDPMSHTATALDNSWDTGTLSQHEEKDLQFDEAGTYQYHCKFHPSMTGTLVVE